MSFKDEIRTAMPTRTNKIENAVGDIKGALRLKAMAWHKETPFSAVLYLPFSLNSEYLSKTTIYEEKKGLFSEARVPLYTAYSLTEKAHTFQKQLSEVLSNDGIKVGAWKLVEELSERGYGARGDFKDICSLEEANEIRIQTRVKSASGRGVTSQFQEFYLLLQNIRLHYPCIALEIFFSEEETI